MTLKEELEILRGEPIQVFDGDPMEIPCIETSDAEKLCKNPVVSVHMITYNHEPYIREAIEGVMMQKTDFEFELIIGEDCSQDKTREICFEYQKKYPDKIRVLWWHENVSKLGGNGRRVTARCRGEFIAFCEGDDYWTDPLKLQKQVDVMRKHPDVGLCFTDGISISGTWRQRWSDYTFSLWFAPNTVLSQFQCARMLCLGRENLGRKNAFPFFLTASALLRVSVLKVAQEKYDIFKWRLTLGDLVHWLGVASLSSVCYVPIFAVERHVLPTGAQTVGGDRVFRDGFLVRYYFANKEYCLSFQNLPSKLRHIFWGTILGYMKNCTSSDQVAYMRNLLALNYIKGEMVNPFYVGMFLILRFGLLRKWVARVLSSFHYRIFLR